MAFDPKAGDRSNIYTAKEYGDFQFRFEFQLTPGANSGVGIRAPREGDAAYVGMEIQVLDDTAPVYTDLQPYQYHGSVYGDHPREARRAEAGGRVELRGDLDQGFAHHGDGERHGDRGRRPGRSVAQRPDRQEGSPGTEAAVGLHRLPQSRFGWSASATSGSRNAVRPAEPRDVAQVSGVAPEKAGGLRSAVSDDPFRVASRVSGQPRCRAFGHPHLDLLPSFVSLFTKSAAGTCFAQSMAPFGVARSGPGLASRTLRGVVSLPGWRVVVSSATGVALALSSRAPPLPAFGLRPRPRQRVGSCGWRCGR